MKRSSVLVVLAMLISAIVVQAADVAFTITISDDAGNANALIADFAAATGWTATIPNPMNPSEEIPNPQTRGQWSKGKIQDYVKNVIRSYRAQVKAKAALKKELTDTDAVIIFK